MGSRRIGMLFCGLLVVVASTASAEGRGWSVGYVVRTPVTMAMPVQYRRYASETFIDLMSKPFAPVGVSSVARWDAAFRDFRGPDPEITLPKAFRRPAQVSIGFSFRF